MAKIKLEHPITQSTYGGRFSPRGSGIETIRREGNTFHFYYEQPGKDYKGWCSMHHYGGSITLTEEELGEIAAHPDDDPWLLSHAIAGNCDARRKVAIICHLRKKEQP